MRQGRSKLVELALTAAATGIAGLALLQSCNARRVAENANAVAKEANAVAKAYQDFEYAAQLEIGGTSDPTHPSLKKPPPGYAYTYREEHGDWPRWFEFKGQIKNVGQRTVRILRVTLCFEPEESEECVRSFGLLKSFWLKPDESEEIEYDPLFWSMGETSEKDPFDGIEGVTIALYVRYEGPGGEAKLLRERLYGYRGDHPVIKFRLQGGG